jgi:translation initiation factor 2 alpha subunit (eIF-2alpha)
MEEVSATKVLDINDFLKIGATVTAMVIKVENKEGYTVLSRKRVVENEAKERIAGLPKPKKIFRGKYRGIKGDFGFTLE